MSRPKAYDPQHGYMYQLLMWDQYNREYDHLDYAADTADKNHLVEEYMKANHTSIKVIKLPKKYWSNAVL